MGSSRDIFMDFYDNATNDDYQMLDGTFEDYSDCLAELNDTIRNLTSPRDDQLVDEDHGILVQPSLSPESYSSSCAMTITFNDGASAPVPATGPSSIEPLQESWRPIRFPKTNDQAKSFPSGSEILSFSNANLPLDMDPDRYLHFTCPINENQYHQLKAGRKREYSSSLARAPNAQDHTVAERKRREKLNHGFISLSAMVPGLTRMDKASILESAAKHLEQLQDRIKILEERVKERRFESAIVCVKQSSRHVTSANINDDQSSASSNIDDGHETSNHDILLPEIEARVLEKTVLIRIHCDRQPGLLGKLLRKLEELLLSVSNNSVMPFGDHHTLITIIAQMEAESGITASDLVQQVRATIL